jgi:hypothetical protein
MKLSHFRLWIRLRFLEILTDIMEKYVSLRGSNGIYLGAIHQDKEHVHLHVAVSGTCV